MADPEPPPVLNVLEALKQASHDLQAHPSSSLKDFNSSAIKALLELQTESNTILSKDPNLSTLSQHLSSLKTLVETLQRSRGLSFRNFLTRRVSTYSITRVAGSIETEIQAWIDRESIENLIKKIKDPCDNEDELVKILTQFEERVSLGFDRELQDIVLKSKVFSSFETIICNSNSSKRLKEQSAYGIAALMRFNKDVFVGQVLMGPTVQALITMASIPSINVLCGLIKSIKSPLVDEIESNGEIPKIINLLDVKDLQMRVVAMDCLLEIGYFGRKEAIEAMLKEGLVKKLVELQRSELGGDLIEMEKFDKNDEKWERNREGKQKRFLEMHPFASCVARFAVQLEVGEGLRQREKRAFKQEILVRVREASVSDAEAATIVAEVLWGSSP
ncbi:hypothetical protein Patl1_13917 [Pistacia atlantica]|uniref:Uncharacterized protein n=1 Tax=Pistacia atlantica TaxID=434234 RepID=A0ACC1AXD3_9ROSI|nr:hypothetical protein Patl1_13917 [Pistacia atlantica]